MNHQRISLAVTPDQAPLSCMQFAGKALAYVRLILSGLPGLVAMVFALNAIASTVAVRAHVSDGTVEGQMSNDGVRMFKGIPFAAPPVGPLRWHEPEPPLRWNGVLDAKAYGHACMQVAPQSPTSMQTRLFFTNQGEGQSEDCLTVNVWSTANHNDKRPVLVWIYGGGFRAGASSNPLYDGKQMARKGVIFVSFNYRVGRFGFFAHPLLSAESGTHSSGNYGLFDQIAALKWVKKNIQMFGGDPENVTIAGQSAGSISIAYLMASPLAHGLFQRAIGESGAAFGPMSAAAGPEVVQDLAHAQQDGEALGRALGASTADQLRALPADAILNARPVRGPFSSSWPIIDGYVIPRSLRDTFAQGAQNDVPLLTGSVADEGTMFPHAQNAVAFVDASNKQFGAVAPVFLNLYPAKDDHEAICSSEASRRDAWFAWQNWAWVRAQAEHGKAKSYYYYFDQPLPAPAGQIFDENPANGFRATHGTEIAYVLGNLDKLGWPITERDRKLSNQLNRYWLNFIATGNPNQRGLPQWEAFDSVARRAMYLGPTVEQRPMHDLMRFDFWDQWFSTRPVM